MQDEQRAATRTLSLQLCREYLALEGSADSCLPHVLCFPPSAKCERRGRGEGGEGSGKKGVGRGEKGVVSGGEGRGKGIGIVYMYTIPLKKRTS